VYLLDEPFTGMGDERAGELARLIAGAVARGSLAVATAPSGEAGRAARLLGEALGGGLVACGIEGRVLECGGEAL
jgi:ABC-type transport system involved in cytochrome c biogenesis ATPase subunit